MPKKELVKISIRVDKTQLKRLKTLMGLDDSSKVIRGAMNVCLNVAHNMFGGEIKNIFKRKKDSEEIELYENEI